MEDKTGREESHILGGSYEIVRTSRKTLHHRSMPCDRPFKLIPVIKIECQSCALVNGIHVGVVLYSILVLVYQVPWYVILRTTLAGLAFCSYPLDYTSLTISSRTCC
jgi:hypothetical protein